MPTRKINGVDINYEIVGDHGQALALMPGARRGYAEMLPLARMIAEQGFRVLLHDRRNTGASGMLMDDSETEEAIWADELHELLKQLDFLPAYISGSSSGARTAIMFALRHPDALRGLMIMRVSGGPVAAERLPKNYYQVYIDLARKGGMQAVADSDRFREYNSSRPGVREQLLGMDVEKFIEIQSNSLKKFVSVAGYPVMGASEEELNTIQVPTVVIPGNDRTHSSKSGEAVHRMIKGSELHCLPITDEDVDLISWQGWVQHEPEIARVFVDFMKRTEQARR